MLHSFEDEIKARAYAIWVSAGMADGMAHDHWISAEQAVLNEHAKLKRARAKPKIVSAEPGTKKSSAASGRSAPRAKAKAKVRITN